MKDSRIKRGTAPRLVSLATVLTLALAAMAGPAMAVPGPAMGSPVLNLQFEGTLGDSSTAAHTVTAHGHLGTGESKYSFVEGVAAGSQALALAGGTYLDLGASTQLQPENLTLSFWINPTGPMSGEQVISWNKKAYNSDGWYLSSESDEVPLALSIGPGEGQPYKVRVADTNRGSFLPAGEWTHIVATYDAATQDVSFYRNGVKVPSVVAAPAGGASTGVLGSAEALPKTIGFNGPDYNGAYLKAGLDEYRLYDGVAALTDVVGLYEESGRTLDRKALAEAAAKSLALPGTATENLPLSAQTANGSTVSWTSSHPAVVSANGQVTRPEEGKDDAEVTLSATVRYAGGPAASRVFTVRVPALGVAPGDVDLSSVAYSDDYLANAAAKEHDYLLELNSKKFLYWFYRTAGLQPPTDTGYEGWEDGGEGLNFRGHAFGHYMSALAMSYASTKDQVVKDALYVQITDAVNGLAQVQKSYDGTSRAGYISPFRDTALDEVEGIGRSDDPVIVPYYNLHKVLAGLLDIDRYVDGAMGAKALDIAAGFGGYLSGRVDRLGGSDTLLRTEYGGMNDALYELFDRTGDVRFKTAAEGFDEVSLFKDLAAGKDVLSGRHANTTIPKLIGALKRYTVFTQNPKYYAMLSEAEKANLSMYYNASVNFWDMVVDHHSYATGANSQSEHFHAADSLWNDATQKGTSGNPQTAETCNEYNMLKLTRELFKLTSDVGYADYYENTFINTILSSQNPDTGMTMYFQPMAPGYNKVYGLPFTEFWCCIGTGMENFSKLGDSIYFGRGKGVYVNMFFSSALDYREANMRVVQEASLPNSGTVRFTVEALDGGTVAEGAELRLRVPDWAAETPTLRVNGVAAPLLTSLGYAVVPVQAGDSIEYVLPMEVQVLDLPDNPDFVAFKYGPVLLSAGLGTAKIDESRGVGIGVRIPVLDETAQTTVTVQGSTEEWKSTIGDNVVRIDDAEDGQIQFKLKDTSDGGDLVFTPHYLRHDERYMLYVNIEVPDSAASQQRILDAKEKQRALELNIDSLTIFDNNNFEADKGKKSSQNSTVGLFGDRQFRHAEGPDGWFSYDLAIDPSLAQNFLRADYYTGDKGRTFDVFINDEKLKTEVVNDAAGENVFYPQYDPIPAKFLTIDANTRYKTDSRGQTVLDDAGNKIPVVTVRFQSTGTIVGGVFGVYTTGPQEWSSNAELSALTFDVGTLSPAFLPGTADYTLSVPAGTERVSFDADPAMASGLVHVGGVLIDDTKPRSVALDDQGTALLVLRSTAQDHTTTKEYVVALVPENVSDPTAPGTTEPGETEPGETAPGTTEPGETGPGETAPGTSEAGATTPGDAGTGPTGTASGLAGLAATGAGPVSAMGVFALLLLIGGTVVLRMRRKTARHS